MVPPSIRQMPLSIVTSIIIVIVTIIIVIVILILLFLFIFSSLRVVGTARKGPYTRKREKTSIPKGGSVQ